MKLPTEQPSIDELSMNKKWNIEKLKKWKIENIKKARKQASKKERDEVRTQNIT